MMCAQGHIGMDRPPPHFYAGFMSADFAPTSPDEDPPETGSEREDRIRWEAAVIARAQEQVAAGDVIDGDALDAWFEALEHDVDAPFPQPAGQPLLPRP